MTTQVRKRSRKANEPEGLPALRLFSTDEYCRMAELGILRPDERVELLAGEIFQMAAMGSRHVSGVLRIARWFTFRLGDKALVISQSAVRLRPQSMPEPDVAIVKYRDDFYAASLPGPEDVLLLIEVADTSIGFDRDKKLPLYAAAGIPEVWIVDLNGRRVLVYRGPAGERYADVTTLTRGGTLTPQAFPDLTLPVETILP